ncbi:hypothetical protein QR680_005897 [Steinernema hermaphroditum]|uniref:Uncharacterized protein n=1 Tax=Steinernema hermaphroditum TaxID=289476 RepID=A0AA39HV19_9BILA|nr:hypothetical protein QR680_005897 [Steinernema hermaphroditum]
MDVFLHGSCLVCQTKVPNDDEKQRHLLEEIHQNKVAVYSFMKSGISQMTKSYDGASAFYSHSSKRNCSVIGLECIYELSFPWASSAPLWICTMCLAAGDSLASFDAHVDSDSHKEIYLNDYGEDTGLAMPELYAGDAPQKVVYERLKLDLTGSGDCKEAPEEEMIEVDFEEVESIEADVDEKPGSTVEEPKSNGTVRMDSPSDDLPTATIGGQFGFQRCGNSSFVNHNFNLRNSRETARASFDACGLSSSEATTQKRAAEAASKNSTPSVKKPRLSAGDSDVFNEDDVLVIDMVSDSEDPNEVTIVDNTEKPEVEMSAEEKKQEEAAKRRTRNASRRQRGKAKAASDSVASNGPPIQYPHLSSRTCFNSTRKAANVLVLTPSNGSNNQKATNKNSANASQKDQKNQKASQAPAKPALQAKPSPSSSTSKAQPSTQKPPKPAHSKTLDQSQKPVTSKAPESNKRSHSPGYVRPDLPYMTDSHKPPTPLQLKQHVRSPPPPREVAKHREARRDVPPGPPPDGRCVKDLEARMYRYEGDIIRMESRRDLVEYLWKQGVQPIRPDDSKAIFFNAAVSAIPDIVGATNLHPVEILDRPDFETLYCGMCAFWTTCAVMLDKHLVSYIHRMNYLSRNYQTFYKIVKDEHDKVMKEKLLAQYIKQIWKNEGSGMMTHKLKCVLSPLAVERLWPDHMKFHSEKWKKGVKVEIIHQAAQQEAYERACAEMAKERERHREEKERRRSRSRSRERSRRFSPERRRDDRERDYDRGREYDRDRDRERERHRERRHSPRRSPSRAKWSPPRYDGHHDSRDRSRRFDSETEGDKQLRLICTQLGIPESDFPMARKIIAECSQQMGAAPPEPSHYRSPSPTSSRLSGLRTILHQALALEVTHQAPPPHQFQMPPTQRFAEPPPPLQQLPPPPIQQQLPPPQDLWQPPIQPNWSMPPPNLSVPPPQPVPQPVPPPFPTPINFSQPPPDPYGYPPPGRY